MGKKRFFIAYATPKRIFCGHSPDMADAVALAVYAKNHGSGKPGEGYSAEKAREVADRYFAMCGG